MLYRSGSIYFHPNNLDQISRPQALDQTMKDAFFAVTGTGGTFVLTDMNPYLAFACGILTLVHISLSLHKMWRERNKK